MRLTILAIGIVMTFAGPAFAATMEAMAGQMIFVGFRGDGVNDAGVKAVRDDIAQGRIGGVLYLKTNVATLNSVRAMNAAFSAAAGNAPPPFIALDQEGGSIERLTQSVGFAEIPSAARVAANQSLSQAARTYGNMAKGLADLGFNTNFGPVADVNLNPNNPIIARYGRSFGTNPEVVTAYAGSFIDGHHNAGVLTALKHFPGHGSSKSDSHEGFVDISSSWKPEELLPFQNLIAQDRADIIMTAHLFHSGISNDTSAQLPASLSGGWIEGILRRDLGYDGVVISDDLEMGAIRSHFSLKQSVILAVRAGTDILLFSNTANYRPSLAQEIQDILVAEASVSMEFRSRIVQSYERIIRLKGTL